MLTLAEPSVHDWEPS
jgi:hypothetical protein